MSAEVVVALVTAPDESTATTIARTLVEESLAACCTILPSVRSIYRWQGSVESADEVMIVVKTTAPRLDALCARIVALHPYDVPEVITLEASGGHEPYLAWVRASVGIT